MTLTALQIAALYKNRWQVELFFKWIKQHLRIKKFLGASENAVKTQIWCAVATYVLIAIIKKSFTSMPRSTLVYRYCQCQFSRKPSFYAPCSPMPAKPMSSTPLTN